jgi:cytochrome c1
VGRDRRRLALLGLVACALGAATGAAWLTASGAEEAAAPAPLAAAQSPAALFRAKGCASCHLGPGDPDGSRPGGDLRGLAAVAGDRVPGRDAAAYVRESILAPGAFRAPPAEGIVGLSMPRLRLAPAEVDALVAYLLAPPA